MYTSSLHCIFACRHLTLVVTYTSPALPAWFWNLLPLFGDGSRPPRPWPGHPPSSRACTSTSPLLSPACASITHNLRDALAFSGPAPERINGRLAMVGFVSALAVEAYRGGGLLSQAGSGSGLAWFAATAAVLSVASLVPLLRGDSAEARSGAVTSADAELWNGRFAMLGLVALAFTEYLTGAPFINA
ncbi:low molecular mass early light-inducible protein HV60, chloroplastic-like [Miscanthus floridulus]|uniref:low molecular mass early light-inducible protein HV60, chloroplastic-like n=1 Tax=Miscanthus floridulus TaxID=154761 RepID=UPI00345A9356